MTTRRQPSLPPAEPTEDVTHDVTRLRAQEALVRALTDAARRFEHRDDASGLDEQIAQERDRLGRYEAASVVVAPIVAGAGRTPPRAPPHEPRGAPVATAPTTGVTPTSAPDDHAADETRDLPT